MKKFRSNSGRASTFQVALSTCLISISAVLLAITQPTDTEKVTPHDLYRFQSVKAAGADSTTNLTNYPNTLVSLSGDTTVTPDAVSINTTSTNASTCPPLITQSTTQTITTGNSISCNNGISHTDNSYWRAFDMGSISGGPYFVDSVSFGMEWANNTQPVTVRLYANSEGAFPGGTRSLIATREINVGSAQNGTVVEIPLSATVQTGASELVMELFTPDGQAAGNRFFVGSNADPQTGPSYLSAPACGITAPTDTAALGSPNMHIVFAVRGHCSPSATPSCPPVITQSTSQAITDTFACGYHPPSGVVLFDNHYWRAFNMTSFVGGAEYDVNSVSFGVKSAGTTQQIIVRLYTNAGGTFPGGTRTLLAASTILVTSAQSGTVVTSPLMATMPAGTSELVMELFSPETGSPDLFLMGMNTAPETGPSYWSCQNDPPQVLNNHLVFNIYGSCTQQTPTPTPTATATATAPPTPTPCPLFTITGAVGQCATAGPSAIRLPGVTMTRTDSGGSTTTTTDGSGNYTLFALQCLTPYTVTPSMAAQPPGSAGIDTIDVVAVRRHFLAISLLTGCGLAAADCASPSGISTTDVIAIQRFFLGLTTGIGNVGQYDFTPMNRLYSLLFSDQTAQNYDAIVFGDVAAPFAAP